LARLEAADILPETGIARRGKTVELAGAGISPEPQSVEYIPGMIFSCAARPERAVRTEKP
jgi:hypothetical protein